MQSSSQDNFVATSLKVRNMQRWRLQSTKARPLVTENTMLVRGHLVRQAGQMWTIIHFALSLCGIRISYPTTAYFVRK